MEVKKLFQKRTSVRSYQKKDVPKDLIENLINSARLAPSAVNLQPWKIYIATSGDVRKQLNNAYPKDWFEKAPALAVFCGLQNENWMRKDGRSYLMCDVTILADYFVLAATEAGLGTCYVAAFDESKVKSALNLSGEEPVLLLPFGYPAPDVNKKEKKRKMPDEIVTWV